MKNKFEFLVLYQWYALFVSNYNKPMVAIFVLLSIAMPIITFFTCPLPVIDDIREEFVVRGSRMSGRSLQFHNLKSLSTHQMDFLSYNSTKSDPLRKYSFDLNEEKTMKMETTNSKACSDYLFDFKEGKRIIIKVAMNDPTNKSQYSTFDEIKKLCKIENRIKATCNEDCVTIITKSEVYRRILRKQLCNKITNEDILLANELIRNFTQKLMEKENKSPYSITDCWIMRFFYYIIPLDSTNIIEMDYPGVSMLFFDFSELEMYNINSIYDILLKNNIAIIGTKTQNENEIVQHILKNDLSKESFVLIAILILLFFCGKSVIISLFTFFILLNAILISYIVYTHILKIFTFPFINFLNFIILIALGADDIIVYLLKWNKIKNLNICENLKLVKTVQSTLPTIFATSFSTILSLLFCFTSSIVAIKCFACYGALLISTHFILIFCFLPPLCCLCCSIQSERKFRILRQIIFCHEFGQRIFFDKLCNVFVRHVVKLYKVIFVNCLILFSISLCTIFLYPKLTYPKQLKNDILRSSHSNIVYNGLKNKFTFERNNHLISDTQWVVNIVWGVEDYDNRSWLNLNHYSTIMINKKFTMSDRETILWFMRFCEIIDTNIKTPNEIKDFINDRKLVGKSNCPFDSGTLSLKTYTTLYNCSRQSNFYNQINECINKFNDVENSQNNYQFHYQNDEIVGFIISFNLDVSSNDTYSSIISKFRNVENWFSTQIMLSPPNSLKDGFLVFQSEKESLYLLYSAIEQYLPMSFCLAFVSAGFVGLLILWDWKLIGIMLLVLVFIIAYSVATLVWLDWNIGIIEAAIFTIATGLGIDFCLHFSVAIYRRKHKSINFSNAVELALMDVVWPITLTAITTCLPGIPLANSSLVIFNRLAVFLFVVTSCSWMCVLLIFPSFVLFFNAVMFNWRKCFGIGTSFNVQLI